MAKIIEKENKIKSLENTISELNIKINEISNKNNNIINNDNINVNNDELNKKIAEKEEIINSLKKELEEKEKYIEALEKEKDSNLNNETKVISDTGNFQINKLKDLNKLLQEKCNKLKTENQQLKQKLNESSSSPNNNNSNNAEELEKELSLIKSEKQNLEKKNKEEIEKVNNLNITIDNMSKEISSLKLKLLKSNSNSSGDKNVEILESKIKDQKNKIESLIKQNIEVNKDKITETSKLKIEISELKVEINKLKTELEENKKKLNELLYKKLNNCMEELNKVYNNDFVLSEKNIKILSDLAFSIQFLFKYLVKYNLPDNIPLFFIYENLFENFKSIKQISKLLFQNPDFEIKHLYFLYEYLELHLFPFFLNQINQSYATKFNTKHHSTIIKLLKDEEFKKNIIFSKEELIEAIRKFMCRYLVSKDKSIVENTEDNLLKLLSKKELWPEKYAKKFSLIKESLECLNKLLIKPILVKNTLNLFDILLEINPNNTNERTNLFMQKQQNFANITVQFIFQTFQIILNKNKFGGQNKSIGQKIDNLTSFIENPDSIIEFKELKQYEIGITNDKNYYICKLDNNKIITSHRGNPLKVLSYDENTFRYQKRLTKLVINGLNEIEDSNNVNFIKILRDNSIVLCCFEKPKIIILKIENNTANLIQTLDGSSYSCGEFYNCFEFDYDKLVTSSQQNIIIWKRESNNNSFEYYNKISTNYNTNIVYINDLMFAAYVSDNTIRFYNNEFSEIGKIDNIKSAFDPLSLCALNNEILGVVGRNNHSIYLIDINNKKLIKEANFENYTSDYLSLSVLLDNTIIVNDSSQNCLHLRLVKNIENNDYDLKLINSLQSPCAETYTFEYLFEEIFIICCVNGHFFGYLREV